MHCLLKEDRFLYIFHQGCLSHVLYNTLYTLKELNPNDSVNMWHALNGHFSNAFYSYNASKYHNIRYFFKMSGFVRAAFTFLASDL